MATLSKEDRLKAWIVGVALVALASAAQGTTYDTTYSQRGDPHRWYVPADTPQAKYDNAAREARNALAEQLRECHPSPDRKRCEAEARARYRDDMVRALEHLAPNRQLA